MASFNRVIFIGRLTHDPEMRYTASGLAVTNFSIAVNRRKGADGQEKTDFFRCNAWRQLAEIVNEYAHKGMLVAVDGSIRINEYTAQDGSRKQSVDVEVDTFQMLDRRDDAGGGGYSASRDSDSSYHPDDEDRASRAPQRAQAPARAESRGDDDEDRPARPARAQAPARSESREAPARGESERPAARRAPAKATAEPMYPADDFDDSDPFADE